MKSTVSIWGSGLVLFFLGSLLQGQTEKSTALPVEDPLVVAAKLSREVDGTPDNQDQLLSLDECLLRTFTTNPQIQEQKTLIEQALGEKLVLRSRAFPDAKIGFLAGQQGQRTETTKAQEFAVITGNFSQPLFEASIPAAFRRANIGVIVAQQNFQFRTVQILHEARLNYYQALYQRGTLSILNELQKPLNDNIKMSKDLVTTGLGSRSSVIQAEIRSLQLVPGRETARQKYKESLSLLAQSMGSNLKDPAAVQVWPRGPLPYLPVDHDLAAATKEALANRPDLHLLRSLIQQTTEDRRMVQGGYYPEIRLVGDLQYLPNTILADSNSSRPTDNVLTTRFLIGPTYSWKVIDTGVVAGAALSLEKVKENYEIQLADLEQNIPKNIAEIYRALELAQKRVSSLAKSVRLAEENLRTVQDLISLNQASQLDFIEARNSLLQTKQGMLDAFYQNSVALANLDLATGRYLRYVDSQDRKK